MSDHPLASTVRRDDAPDSMGASRGEWHLFLVMEAARPLAGGARWSLQDSDIVEFGRGTERSASRDGRKLVVRAPDAMASSSHAKLVRDGARWTLSDAGSTNGTFVDGERVEKETLEGGEVFEIGETLFVLERLSTPRAARDVDVITADERAHGLVTLLPEYARSLGELRRVMASDLPLLLLGESGTGKEVLARATHAVSKRSGELVAVNCGAIPEALVEGQLFGHVKGAFSGAVKDELGFVRASDRGTLFLDEIGDLPRTSQAALLRVLQEREVVSVGATRAVRVDLRVVSATHRPVSTLSMSDKFRHDLYARLAGYVHELLPVRARKWDLGIFVAELLARTDRKDVRISIDLARAMLDYDWPLNLRELQHALSAMLVFADDGRLKLRHAPAALREPARSEGDDALRATLERALTHHRGNVSEIARELGKTRTQIHRWMQRFKLDPASYRK
jgi:transcriptional regulator of acetoin/glycerol metabolism